MKNRPVQKKSKKREQVVETAKDLFMRHGIKRITIEEICHKAGASKMTFYKYFPNKIELAKHVWQDMQVEGFKKLDEIDAMELPLPEKIQMMFNWKREFVSNISDEFIKEIVKLQIEIKEPRTRFMKFIMDAQERGEVRPEILPEFIIAVLDKLNELIFDEALIKCYPSFIEFNREFKDFFWYGIYARPASGRKE